MAVDPNALSLTRVRHLSSSPFTLRSINAPWTTLVPVPKTDETPSPLSALHARLGRAVDACNRGSVLLEARVRASCARTLDHAEWSSGGSSEIPNLRSPPTLFLNCVQVHAGCAVISRAFARSLHLGDRCDHSETAKTARLSRGCEPMDCCCWGVIPYP